MKFSEALEHLLAGEAMERSADYNHHRVFLVKGSIDLTPEAVDSGAVFRTPATSEIPLNLFDGGDKDTGTRLPRFDAVDYADNTVTGWTPTATDLLATDWEVASNEGLDA